VKDKSYIAAHNACEAALNKLLRDVFGPGVELTLLMRDPKNAECYMVITNDDLDDVIATIEKSKHPAVVHNPPTTTLPASPVADAGKGSGEEKGEKA
jgi:hypothetical protein